MSLQEGYPSHGYAVLSNLTCILQVNVSSRSLAYGHRHQVSCRTLVLQADYVLQTLIAALEACTVGVKATDSNTPKGGSFI